MGFNLCIIGTGTIANEFAESLKYNRLEIYSAYNQHLEKARYFQEKYGIKKIYQTLDEALSDENVDAVYIATFHTTHFEIIKKALQHHKHVLAEKAITLNSAELKELVSLAKENHLILMEAMTIYHMPIYHKLKEIIEEKSLGKVNVITCNFGSYKEYDPKNRLFNKELGGGALLDIGVYPLSFVRLFFNKKPTEISSFVKMGPSGVDETESIILKNEDNQFASVMVSFRSKQPKRATISLDRAFIEIMEYSRGTKALITYTSDGHTEEICEGSYPDALFYEYQDFKNLVLNNKTNDTLEYTQDVMEVMTSLRKSWNFKYKTEK